jgi:NADH-quinone oxidoreductase subunit J
MTRYLITMIAAVGVALGGARVAAAQDALAPDAPAAQPLACAANIKQALDAAFPGNTGASCRVHKTTRRMTNEHAMGGSQMVAGTVDAVEAEVALSDGRIASVDLTPTGEVTHVGYAHSDLTGSTSKGMAILFWAFALASVVGAVFVITRRNLIAAVMGMVGSFLGIAAVYMLLYAQFLAVIQMLVYAGAIMVLFVFVVMILNRPEDEPVAPAGRAGQIVGGIAILYLVGRLVLMLTQVVPPDPKIAMAAPPPLPAQCVEWQAGACLRSVTPEWGSVSAVGTDLFGPGLFPFEATAARR